MSALETDVSCAVCCELYEEGVHDPIMLPHCGHTFCRSCLLSLEDTTQPFLCPSCRKPHIRPPVANLPVTFALLSICRTLKAKKSCEAVEDVCEAHDDPLRLWCRECQRALCGMCLYDGHITSTHTIVKVHMAVQEKKKTIEQQVCRVRESIKLERDQHTAKARSSIQQLAQSNKAAKDMMEKFRKAENLEEDSKTKEGIKGLIEISKQMRNLIGPLMNEAKIASCPDLQKLSENSSQHLKSKTPSPTKSKRIQSCDEAEKADCKQKTEAALWPLTCCKSANDSRWARLKWEEGKLFLYSLSHHIKDADMMIQIPLVQLLVPSDSTEVFMDLTAGENYIGRIQIRLWGKLPRAQHFLALCLGTLGPSYRGAKFININKKGSTGECLVGGNYVTDYGTSCAGLIQGLECDNEAKEVIREGLVVASGSSLPSTSAQFCIFTHGEPGGKTCCPIGKVISGLEVVREAVQHNPTSEVKISEVGLVVPQTNRLEHNSNLLQVPIPDHNNTGLTPNNPFTRMFSFRNSRATSMRKSRSSVRIPQTPNRSPRRLSSVIFNT